MTQTTLDAAIAGMKNWPRWYVWQLSDWNGKKYNTKLPWAHRDMVLGNKRAVKGHTQFAAGLAHAAGMLMSYPDALAWLAECRAIDPGRVYALGWWVMPDAGYWFLDLDEHVTWPQGYGGAPHLSGIAHEAIRLLPGCAGEYSSSTFGLHFFGRGVLGTHKTKGRGMPDHVELYSKERGICFGLTGHAWGNADTPGMPPWRIEDIDTSAALPGGRMAEWSGPEDDDELIARLTATKRGDAAALLTGKATLSQLWAGDVLDKFAGASEMDGALATHLAWWTGCDVERMIRLMWRSGCVRDKWEADGHLGYVRLTCETAARRHIAEGRGCFSDAPRVPVLPLAPALPTIAAAVPLEVIDAAQHRGVPGAILAISSAGNTDELKAAAVRIAAMQVWDSADLETLAQRMRRKSKELIGEGWSIALCRSMLLGKGDDTLQCAAPDWLGNWVFVTSTNKYCNVAGNFTMVSREALQVALYAMPEIPLKPNGDKEDVAKMFNMWGVQIADAVGYNPRADLIYLKHGQRLLNSFYDTMPDVEGGADVAAIEVFKLHVWNVADHNRERYELMLKWMAHVVQKPGHIMRWALIIIGLPGTGKTMFSKPLAAALGAQNVKLGGSRGVNNQGGFMDWVASAQMLGLVNDFSITGRDKYEVAEAVKPVITDDIVSITSKGAKDIVYDNYASYIFTTNSHEPMPLTLNERRWYMAATRWLDQMVTERKDEAAEYYGRLKAAIDSLSGGQWRAWFESIPCDGLPMVAPVTAEMTAIIANGRSESHQALEELVHGHDVVTSNKISEVLRGVEGAPSKRGISRAMNELGFDYYDKRVKIGPAVVGIYTRRAVVNAVSAPWELIRAKATQFNEQHDAAKFAGSGVTRVY